MSQLQENNYKPGRNALCASTGQSSLDNYSGVKLTMPSSSLEELNKQKRNQESNVSGPILRSINHPGSQNHSTDTFMLGSGIALKGQNSGVEPLIVFGGPSADITS